MPCSVWVRTMSKKAAGAAGEAGRRAGFHVDQHGILIARRQLDERPRRATSGSSDRRRQTRLDTLPAIPSAPRPTRGRCNAPPAPRARPGRWRRSARSARRSPRADPIRPRSGSRAAHAARRLRRVAFLVGAPFSTALRGPRRNGNRERRPRQAGSLEQLTPDTPGFLSSHAAQSNIKAGRMPGLHYLTGRHSLTGRQLLTGSAKRYRASSMLLPGSR